MKPHATPPSLSPLSPKDHSATLQNPFRNSLAKASPLIGAINRNSRTKAQPPKRANNNRTRTISCEQDPENTYEINRNGNSKDLPNRIKVISGLDSFRKLQILDLSHNTIEKMENLSKLINLMSLNLSYNKISKLENISTLKNLEILDLSNNLIQEIPSNIEANYNLSELRISSNLISTSQSIYSLQKLEKLVILDMSNNPITSTYDYPFLIKLNLKKLYYLDGKIVSRAVGKTPKENNQSIHMIDHASSISRYSNISNTLYPPGQFLDGEKPSSSQFWFDETALSSRSRMTMMSVGSVKNQYSYMGDEQSQRSTVNAGKRLSSFGSAEPVEMEASQLSQFYFTNLPAFEIEKNTNKLKSSLLLPEDKENSTIEHSYNNDRNKPTLTVDVQTPRLDELLQLNGTAKDVEKVKKSSSQIDTLFQTTKDIRGFLNRIRKDKGQESKSFIKDHYSRKGDESDNGSVSTSPIRTPTNNNEGMMKISGTFQRELFTQNEGANIDELKRFTNEKVAEWNRLAKEIDSQKYKNSLREIILTKLHRTATLSAVNYLENMMANAADELERTEANTHPSHDLLKEVTELIPTTREFFDALDRLQNYQKAYLRVSVNLLIIIISPKISQQIELGQPEGPKTLEEKRTNLKELFENLNWMRHKVLELVSKILNLEISVISKQVNTPTSQHKRGVLKELTVFDPYLNDIIPKFHQVKKDHELQIQILTQIHQKYQQNSDTPLTTQGKKSLTKGELSNNKKKSSENVENKENVNDVNLPSHPTERFNQSPVLTVRKENMMNTSKNNEGGRYEITYEEADLNQKLNEKSMMTARTSLRLEGVRNSNSMDSGHFFTKRNKGCALRQSDSIVNLDGNTTRKNAIRESLPTDLVIHDDENSSQSSALKDKKRESWGTFKQEIAKLNRQITQLQKEKEQDTQTIQVLQDLCNVNMLKLDEMRNKVNSAVEKSLTASQNPLVWVMQAQTTIMEGLVQQNKQLQEKINTMAFTYNPTVQTIESICSISESEAQEKAQPHNDDKLNTDLSSIHQRSETKTDKNLLSDNKSPPARPRDDSKSKSESKNSARKVSINLDSVNSYTDAKERKTQDSRLTSGTSLKKKKKSKEFTFKREGSDVKSPNPLEQPNTQEFSIRNKLSFEKGENVSYSMSSINNSESKANRDFQHVSLQKSSLKIPRLQHETSKKGLGLGLGLEGILYEIADNEVATQTDEVEYAIGSQTDRLRDAQESISPSKRLLTEPVPVTSSSQGFNEAGRAYFNHSNIHENIAQYFKERVQTLANNKNKKISQNICQYKTLKDKIIERTGKEIKRSKTASGSGIFIQKREPSGNPRTPTAHHYPLPIPSSWANVSPMTQKDKISFEPKSVGKGSLRSSSTKAQGGMSVNRPPKKGNSISKLPTGLPKKKILNLPEAEFYDSKFDFESPHHPFFVSLTQKAQHRAIKSSSSQANLLVNGGQHSGLPNNKRSFVTCPDEF